MIEDPSGQHADADGVPLPATHDEWTTGRSLLERIVRVGVVAAIALSLTPIFVVTGFRLLATDTFVRWELGRDDFPPDPFGLDAEDRTALALIGLRSIQPGTEGIVLLERATLPGGARAFQERELRHMRDVRRLFDAALRFQLVALIVLVAAALALMRTRFRSVVPAGLLAGSLLTLAIALLAVPAILFGFEGFFTRFHEVFFSGSSWEFASSDTLIRIYPERFWIDVSRIAAGIAVCQALVLAPLAWWWLRAARRTAA